MGAAVNLLVAELFDWFPWMAVRLIRRGVRRLPIEVQGRYEDEWLGELDALPGRRVSLLVFAVHIWIGASKVRKAVLAQADSGTISYGLAFKYAFDRLFTLACLVVLLPVLLCLALAVRLSSRGPVLVGERRVGYSGEEFFLYKFRTMRVASSLVPLGSNAALGGVERDRHRTLVGRFLWRTALDELPQFFSVLRGEMSLIGPRPGRGDLIAQSQHAIPRQSRFRVKSGITGWAQVQGLRRHKTSPGERVEWDNYYIAHWSLGLDLKIALLTMAALFRNP
jgi:lipopolysaccharide/colanic/teichoic acid biosynthesis glycosyltransferase